MEEGSLRVDANVSALHGTSELGTKTEVKNMNSFSGVVRAGRGVRPPVLGAVDGRVESNSKRWWDANTGRFGQLSKEGSHDYRYFPEPTFSARDSARPNRQDCARASRIAQARRGDIGAESSRAGRTTTSMLTASAAMGEYFEQVARQADDPKTAANWMMGEASPPRSNQRVRASSTSRYGRPIWPHCS